MNVRAYYNENNPFVVEWLRAMMKEGLIPDGEVDTRSIADVRPDDVKGFRQCHFFAGLGGWPLALRLAGYADLECWTGSCPCQPFSSAGKKGGFDDARHLWPVWEKLIEQQRPPIVFGEQVAAASKWLRLVRGDLEAMGYAVGTMPIEAASAGAFHLRDRYWFVADDGRGRRGGPRERKVQFARRTEVERAGDSDVGDAARERRREGRPEPEIRSGWPAASGAGIDLGDAGGARLEIRSIEKIDGGDLRDERSAIAAPGDGSGKLADAEREGIEWITGADGKARPVEPGVRLLAHGIPNRVGALRGFGNAIDPRPAAAFIRASIEAIGEMAV